MVLARGRAQERDARRDEHRNRRQPSDGGIGSADRGGLGLTTAGGTALSFGGTLAVETAAGFTGGAATSGLVTWAFGASGAAPRRVPEPGFFGF
ncbi:MAG TPA: hypothetical protein VGQ99_01265 [Tepidisphaeraceae bacterium]|nr:hypothetical protein [Tepidisphaeraceae bacterium]